MVPVLVHRLRVMGFHASPLATRRTGIGPSETAVDNALHTQPLHGDRDARRPLQSKAPARLRRARHSGALSGSRLARRWRGQRRHDHAEPGWLRALAQDLLRRLALEDAPLTQRRGWGSVRTARGESLRTRPPPLLSLAVPQWWPPGSLKLADFKTIPGYEERLHGGATANRDRDDPRAYRAERPRVFRAARRAPHVQTRLRRCDRGFDDLYGEEQRRRD